MTVLAGPTVMAGAEELPSLSDAELESALSLWAGHLAAGEALFVDLVGEFDARQRWGGAGFTSCAHWLAWRCALSPNAARERVRVARALRGLPQIRAAFRAGTLSYSQVRALTRVATAESEPELLNCARHGTAAQLERLVRGMRRALSAAEVDAAAEAFATRRFDFHTDEAGALVLDRGRLPADDGAVLTAALDAAIADLTSPRRDPAAGQADAGVSAETSAAAPGPPGVSAATSACPADDDVSAGTSADPTGTGVCADTSPLRAGGGGVPAETPGGPALRADALVHLARTALAAFRAGSSTTDGDAFRVLIHIDPASLADDSGQLSAVEGGPALPAETVRRLLCDGAARAVSTLADGTLLDLGRTARFPNRALRRALAHNQPVCGFPGCTRRHRLEAHHIKQWVRDQGRTDLNNLVLLCSYHHHLVHEGGYELTRASSGQITVRHPGGWLLPTAPAPPPSTPARLAEAANTGRTQPITPDTLPPEWYGDRLDLEFAVWAILHAQPHETSPPSAH